MKKFKIFIAIFALMCSMLATGQTVEAANINYNNAEDEIFVINKPGTYVQVEHLNETDVLTTTITISEAVSPRNTSSKTYTAGTITRLTSNNEIISDTSATATFSYDNTYVWGNSGYAFCDLPLDGYAYDITKNEYSSAKVKTKSTYYTTIKVYHNGTLNHTVSNNISCTPNGTISVTH